MTSQQVKTILGALVAIALVLAVSYGVISQQTADQIKAQTDQTLSTGQAAPAPNAAPEAGAAPQPGTAAPRSPAPAPQP